MRSPRWAASAVMLALSTAACVDGDVPARPIQATYAVDGGPEPIQLATGSGCGDVRLVVAGGTVYWTEKGTGLVKSVPTAGGPTKVIASGQSSPGAIAAGESSLFWVAGNAVMKSPLGGGAASVFVKATEVPEVLGDENDVNALLADRGELYFARFTLVMKVPAEAGQVIKIGRSPDEDLGKPGAFAVDETHLYQTELDHLAVSREKLDGTQEGLLEGGAKAMLAPDRLAVSQYPLLGDAIAVANGQVFWASGSNLRFKPVDQMDIKYETLTTTTDCSDVNPPCSDIITGFVVSDGVVYFGESIDDAVARVPLSTGVATVIVKDQWEPRQFAADANAIYWHTSDCKLMKLAK